LYLIEETNPAKEAEVYVLYLCKDRPTPLLLENNINKSPSSGTNSRD